MGIIERYKTRKRRNRFLLKPDSKDGKIEADIRDVLMETCPAFIHSNTGLGAIWHKCLCGDFPKNPIYNPINDEEKYGSCACVWHQTDECHRRKWPQLAFLNTEKVVKI